MKSNVIIYMLLLINSIVLFITYPSGWTILALLLTIAGTIIKIDRPGKDEDIVNYWYGIIRKE